MALGRCAFLTSTSTSAMQRFSELFGGGGGNPRGAIDKTRPFPEVGILSNIKENGEYIGSPDAGGIGIPRDLSRRDGVLKRPVWYPHPPPLRRILADT